MIKKTIEISRQPSYISAKNKQILIQPFDQDKSELSSIPAEDIGVMMVDQPQTTFSYHALKTLMESGSAFTVCGRDHLPLGVMLPISNHCEIVWRVQDQINAPKPTLKRIWQQIVKAKILAQAKLLQPDSAAYRQLIRLAKETKTDDNTNNEGQAARIYWPVWANDGKDLDSNISKPFRRNADGKDATNIMLNYGYGILRAAVGRALVSAGLFPAIGIHHHNRSNNFSLADDLMEPFRPVVDNRVRKLIKEGYSQLDREVKATLLNILIAPVAMENKKGPLMVCLHSMTASLLRCYKGESKVLDIPVLKGMQV